jgi:hypothetical protein
MHSLVVFGCPYDSRGKARKRYRERDGKPYDGPSSVFVYAIHDVLP